MWINVIFCLFETLEFNYFIPNYLCIYSIRYRPGVRNPIQIAALLAKEQMMRSPLLGRIPPM